MWNVEKKVLEAILKDGMTQWAKSEALKLGHAKFKLSVMKI
jgi:hypothetical protein